MTKRTLILAAASGAVLALAAASLSTPSRALPAPGGTAPQTLISEHDNWVVLARGGGGRGGGGGMRGGGGGGRGGGYGGGGGRGAGASSFSGGGGGARNVRSSASSNVNFGANRGASGANRNVANASNRNLSNANVSNRNINNVNVNNINGNNFNGGCGGGCGGWGNGWDHPVAAAATVGAVAAVTANAIGSVAYSLPPGCANINGYYQCGSTYYQPQYSGTDVQYVAVSPPPQ